MIPSIPNVNDPASYILYRYDPSLVAAVIFIVLFSATTVLHLYQLVKFRTWYLIPLLVGGLFEIVGYIGRALSHFNPTSLNPFIIQSLLLLLAPALFAASIYMLLGCLMRFLQAERHSLIRVNWITKLFVCGDVLSFTIQGAGGGIMAGGTLSMLHLGQTVIVVGLFTQLLFFGIFLAAAIVFHSRILKQPTSKSLQVVGRWWLRWNAVLYSLYVASILILVRSVFRIIEYLNGNDGFIQRHEAFLYVFDGVLMLSVMIIFNLIHPGKIINTRTAPQATWLEMGHGPDSSLESTKDERLSSHAAS